MKTKILLFLLFQLNIGILISQNVGISNSLFTPQSYLHVHQPNATGNLLQLTNSTSGNLANNVGFVFSASSNDWTLRNYQAGSFTLQTGNSFMNFLTNNTERMRIGADGSIGIGTSSFEPNYLISILAHQTNTKRSGIYLNMVGQTSTSYGLYITSSNSDSRGVLYENSSSAVTSPFFGLGAVLTSTNIVSGYSAYRTGSGRSYGLYGITGTTSAYTSTNNNTWAAYFQGRSAISFTAPDLNQISDFEIRNTRSGDENPPILSLRHNSSLDPANSILGEIHFGDNKTTNPQARIRAFRDNSSSTSTDLPSAISFSVISDGNNALTDRMFLTSDGRLGISVSTLSEITHNLTVKGSNNAVRLLGTGTNMEGATINFGDANNVYIQESSDDNLRIHSNSGIHFTTNTTARIGVNVTAPQSYIHIVRNANTNFLQLSKSVNANTGLIISVSGTSDWTIRNRDANSNLTLQTASGVGYIRFITNNNDINDSNERMRITSTGMVGINTTNPQAMLDVNGGIRVGDDATTPSADNVGTIRYRVSGNNSYVEMVMQTGATTYEWVVIMQNSW